MDSNAKKRTVIGVVIGVLFAGILAAAVVFCESKYVIIQKTSSYLTSLPAFLATRISDADPLVTAVYFLYWIVVGGVFGFLSGLKTPAAKKVIILFILILILAAGHYLAHAQLSKEIAEAIEALGR